MGNAVILSNSQSVLFLIGKGLTGQPISQAEWLGVGMAFAGVAFCSRDDSSQAVVDPTSDHHPKVLIGDGLAILSAVAGVSYMLTSKYCRSSIQNIYVFMLGIMIIASLTSIVYAYMGGLMLSWDRDDHHGVLGWTQLRKDRLPLELLMVLSCNFLGAIGK